MWFVNDCLWKFVGLFKSIEGLVKSKSKLKDHQIVMVAYHIVYKL